MEIAKTISESRAKIIEKISEYNEVLRENNLSKSKDVEQELKDAEVEYADAKRIEVFKGLREDENPIKAAIKMRSYPIISHKVKREGNVDVGFEIVENKARQIDLVKFCEFCKLPCDWKYTVEKFSQLLACRTATELKLTPKQIAKICDSFFMSDLARKVELGKTPISNTAVCKQLQKIFDEILFEDNGKGKNVYCVNNHDVAYLLMCYTKRGKKALSVAVAKNSYIHSLVFDVMHRVITGKTYDVEYRMIKSESAAKEDVAVESEKTRTTDEPAKEEKKVA